MARNLVLGGVNQMARTSRTRIDRRERLQSFAAPPTQRAEVAALSTALEKRPASRRGRASQLRLVDTQGASLPVPDSVLRVLERAAAAMARGESISIIPITQELTTQQAADLLNVSRQYLVRLIDQGAIASRRTGTHRRVQLEDALAFKARRDRERRAGLRALTRLSEEFGAYDAEGP
jgi:excisionase family DNA binding protein